MGLFFSLLFHGYPNGTNKHKVGNIGCGNDEAVIDDVGSICYDGILYVARIMMQILIENKTSFGIPVLYKGCWENFVKAGIHIGTFSLSDYEYANEYYILYLSELLAQRNYVSAAAFLWCHVFRLFWHRGVIQCFVKFPLLLLGFVAITSLAISVAFLGSILLLTMGFGTLALVGFLFFGGYWIYSLLVALIVSLLSYTSAPVLWGYHYLVDKRMPVCNSGRV